MIGRRLTVLESAEFVAANAESVSIDYSSIARLCQSYTVREESNWLDDSPYDIGGLSDEEKLMFSVVFNSLSFSYWGDPYWTVDYLDNKHARGSWSLVACIFRSIHEGQSLLQPRLLKEISLKDFGHLLRGNTNIPLITARHKIINVVGRVIEDRYQGLFSNFLSHCNHDAVLLQENIITEFAGAFDDSYAFKGKTVFFNKRAQALIETVYSIFKGKGLGNIKNIASLTALADYIIPNLLRKAGVLQYSSELANMIDNCAEIEAGSAHEIEIRGCTIWAIELMRLCLLEQGFATTAKAINDHLWTEGRDVATPFHRTRTTAY